jgi:predicted ATP-dependent endonuclease of OLD family
LLSGNSKDSGQYFVSAKVHVPFLECRTAPTKTKKAEIFKALRTGAYPELDPAKNADEIDLALEKWEDENPSKTELAKVGSFKGFKEVAVARLRDKTEYIFVRAVENASDFNQGKNSPVRELVDAIAKQTIENGDAYKAFLSKANAEIKTLTDPNCVPVLAEISADLTNILHSYYKESKIETTWTPTESIQPSFPTSHIEVTDNDFTTSIDGVGHGLQRAVILSVLQFMARRRVANDGKENFSEAQSDMIIAIEEPEIYQHPVKQRLFCQVLRDLAKSFNKESGIRVQVIFVTHSPVLITMQQYDSIRLVRSEKVGGVRNVVASQLSLAACSTRCAVAAGMDAGSAWDVTKFGAKLHTLTLEVAEGFFAKCVILVEGIGDKALVEAAYRSADRDLNSEGIVVCDVVGKGKLDKLISVFLEIGVKCFWIFDNDYSDKNKAEHQRKKENKILQRLGGIDPSKLEDWPSGVFSTFSAWDGDIEAYVRGVVGQEMYEAVTQEMGLNFDIKPSKCMKFPAAASASFAKFAANGAIFPRLTEIIAAIDNLMLIPGIIDTPGITDSGTISA